MDLLETMTRASRKIILYFLSRVSSATTEQLQRSPSTLTTDVHQCLRNPSEDLRWRTATRFACSVDVVVRIFPIDQICSVAEDLMVPSLSCVTPRTCR